MKELLDSVIERLNIASSHLRENNAAKALSESEMALSLLKTANAEIWRAIRPSGVGSCE